MINIKFYNIDDNNFAILYIHLFFINNEIYLNPANNRQITKGVIKSNTEDSTNPKSQ